MSNGENVSVVNMAPFDRWNLDSRHAHTRTHARTLAVAGWYETQWHYILMMEEKRKKLSDLMAEHKELSNKLDKTPSEKEMRTEIMELTHKYNDIKDAAQTVIGFVANVRRTTIKSVHQELNLPLED